MLKSSELRIGNYVYAKGNIEVVTDVLSCGINLHHDHWDFDYSDLEPIPLSEEILLKCGFVKNGDHIFDHESGDVFDAPTDWNNLSDYPIEIDVSRSVMGWNPEQIIIRCVYLHDLQNKFFAINGEELTVNI